MSAPDFLLEIGCEEIPARMLAGAARDLADRVVGLLDAAGLAHGGAEPYCAPRRLAVIIRTVAPRQEDRDEEIIGPPAKGAVGPGGVASKAAAGFAHKMGVEVGALATVATPRGDYLAVRRRIVGRKAEEVLGEALPGAITAMTFPKAMRWGDGASRFVRPVHWVAALLGSEAVPFELFGVRSGRSSDGHRFLGARRVPLAAAGDYVATLASQNVTVDREERRAALSRRLLEVTGEEGLRPVEDRELLDEVIDLVEHPGAIIGSFPREFLDLPREVLATTLRHHQKAFSTETDEGVSNHFLVVSDRLEDPSGHIRKGNEWVVVGRLEDARFFFTEDLKIPFAERTAKLRQITFHASAGSYADKAARTEAIAIRLAAKVNAALDPAGSEPASRVDAEAVRHAARLAKCDLTTGLVGEFPELQGVAGALYMLREAHEGRAAHPMAACDAVYDQYRPAAAGDRLPRSSEGTILALADRVETLASLSGGVGLPTGSRDPFGLRRAAYGAVRLGVEARLPLSLEDLLEAAAADGPAAPAAPVSKSRDAGLRDFLLERLQHWLKEKGARYDTVEAVLQAQGGTRAPMEPLPRLTEKVFALERLRELPDCAALVEIHKRCRNILQQAEEIDAGARLDTPLKQDPLETEALGGLAGQVERSERSVRAAMERDDFEGALQQLVSIRPLLSRYFDHVLVMHPDPALRADRLGLVRRTSRLIEEVADLRRISMSREELQRMLEQLQ